MKWPLLILCLGVWAAVFYVLFANKETTDIPNYIPNKTKEIQEKESYELLLAYSDPFLKSGVSRKKPKASNIPSIASSNPSVSRSILESRLNRPTKKRKNNVVFPQIKYKGFVKKTAGSGLVSVDFDGQAMHWEKGKEINDIYLMDIYMDSIRIQKDGVRKTIKR